MQKGLMTITIWLKPFYAPADRMIIPFMTIVSSLHGNRLKNWTPRTSQHEDSKTDNSLQDFCLNFIYIYFFIIYICYMYINNIHIELL